MKKKNQIGRLKEIKEINLIETRNQQSKSTKSKASKFSKSPVRLTYEKQRKHKLLLSEIKGKKTLNNPGKFKKIKERNTMNNYADKFDNLDDETDQFVKRHNLPNLWNKEMI